MSDILRLDGAARRDPAIDVWFREQPRELGSLARKWFNAMRACGNDVRELMHDGNPVACIDDAPFAYVDVFTSHMNVGFFHGAELSDPESLLEGSGRRMRHVKLRPAALVAPAALSDLIDAAYSDIKTRLVSRG